MNYQYEVKVQTVEQGVGKLDKSVIRFGDDWPGVFLSCAYAGNFCIRLNESYVNKDTEEMKKVINELYDILHFSDLNINKNNDVLSLNNAGFRVDTGHLNFNDNVSGYFFRGDHAYMLKLGIKSSLENDNFASDSHIPFLINESKHWAKAS